MTTYDDVYEMVNHHPRPTGIKPLKATAQEDKDWCEKQKPFPHTETMPKPLRNYCPHCTEIVANVRVTKGCYLAVDHECPRTRVYDSHGELLEVIS